VEAICRVCAAGWRDTYRETHAASDIEATQRVAVAPDNPKGIGFYRRHGFVEAGRRPGYPAARAAIESLVMERRI